MRILFSVFCLYIKVIFFINKEANKEDKTTGYKLSLTNAHTREMNRVGGHRHLETSRRTRGNAGGHRAGRRRSLLNRRRRLARGRRQRLGTLLGTTGNRDERGADDERCRKFG